MDTITKIIERIERHCKMHDISTSTFGKKAVNDGKLLSRLQAGKSITLDTLQKIEDALSVPEPAE